MLRFSSIIKLSGCFTKDINLDYYKKDEDIFINEDKYWIHPMPALLENGFYKLNEVYHKIYEEKVKPKLF